MTTTKQPQKIHSNFRLSPAGLKLLDRLAKHLGIGRAACLDLAIRELARAQGVR